MSWLFGWNTRKELIEHLVNGNGVKTIAHCFKGNNMWAVQEYQRDVGPLVRFICLYMLRGRDAYNPRTGNYSQGWGYKDVSEDMGPYQTNCPLAYLELVKDFPPYNSTAAEWRGKVREHHARASRKLEVGQKITLYGKSYAVAYKIPHKGYTVHDENGRTWRIKSTQVADVEVVV